jgi:hypothetical protein
MNILINGESLKKVEPILSTAWEQLKNETKEVQELFIYELTRKLYYSGNTDAHWKELLGFCTINFQEDAIASFPNL